MVPPRVRLLLLTLFVIFIAAVASADVVVFGSDWQVGPRRSLLSTPKLDVELVAAPNGTVYLVDNDARKVIWSFSSGPPIYKSYRTPIHRDAKDHALRPHSFSFVDVGDDWELNLNSNFGKLKLGDAIEDYVKKTPIYGDDEVTVGSMHSTVFKVDLWTGRLIHEYGKSVSSNVPQVGEAILSAEDRKESSVKGSDMELYIERIDYSLSTKAFDKLLWNLTIASFKAKVRCRGTDHLLDGASFSLDRKLGSGSDADRIVSLPCEFEFAVRRFRSQNRFEQFLQLEGGDNMLLGGAPRQMLPSVDKDDKFSAAGHEESSFPRREVLEVDKSTHSRRFNKLNVLVRGYVPWSFMLLALLLIGFALRHRRQFELNLETNLSTQPVSSRKKRSRKPGKNIAILEEGHNDVKAIKRWLNLNSLVQGDRNGRTIGKLFVSSKELAKGSSGTVVYEGIYEGRMVAVKRMVQAHHDLAFKEIQNLIASDQHPNIVRWYGVEYDHDFVYLSLELCSCSLNDLIESYADTCHNSVSFGDGSFGATTDYKFRLNSVKAIMKDIKLWKTNGYPSALLLKLMRDVVSGLVHLHELGIIHRDIKPQNVLINRENVLCAKLSDMGISKRLLADMSSLGHHATGHGSSGWQAPEQLLHGRQTRGVDMFSLGSVLFFCVTGGRHPFGERFERDANIIKNKADLFLVENIPEAVELFSRLLQPDPERRPKAVEVLHHPFFWTPEIRLSFLHDASDRVELEDREINSHILKALESVAPIAIGMKWNEKMEPDFISDIGRYRRYKYESVRDLLRVMRNKLNHYRELPANIQALLGPVPDGFDEYFTSRFPRLLIEVYKVVYIYCKSEKWFQKYLQGDVH